MRGELQTLNHAMLAWFEQRDGADWVQPDIRAMGIVREAQKPVSKPQAKVALRQRELTLLRKLVAASISIPEGESYEFLVPTTTEGTTAWFMDHAGGLELSGVATSDVNALARRGYVELTGSDQFGGSKYQVTHEAFVPPFTLALAPFRGIH